MCEDLFQSPEQEINAINDKKFVLRSGGEKKILNQLYPYQENLIRSIYNNKCTVALKSRNVGCTVVYFIHLVMLLYKAYKTKKELYEACNFVIVSPNQMMAHWNQDFVNGIIYQMEDVDFIKTAIKHFKFISSLSQAVSLRGYPHHEITELLFDEYEFFANSPDIAAIGVFNICRVVGITTKNRGKDLNTVGILNDFIDKYANGDVSLIMIPWYACPKFNKNLKWAKGKEIIKEYTIDPEGNIRYRPFVWLTMKMDGWEPYNEWRNDMLRAGLKKEELLDMIFFQDERHEQNLPKFDTWS